MSLSPHYLSDALDTLSDETHLYLDTAYFNQLPHRDEAHPKLLVVFSGGNAVGKSTLSRKIQERFHGLVIENDGVKRALLKIYPDYGREQLNPITWKYTMELYDRLPQVTPNGLVIRDGVIDWYYDRILPVFQKNGYEVFIIAFELSMQKRTELIEARGDTLTFTAERAKQILGDHEVHQARFRAEYTPDVVLTDENVFDSEFVLERLGARLRSMQ